MECKKCKSKLELNSFVILRKNDHYCEDCFINAINHKFRACLGKNKILRANDKVLVCLSGGEGSTVLLDLVQNSVSMEAHKKLRIIPFYFHLIENNNEDVDTTTKLIETTKELYVANISDYVKLNTNLPIKNSIPYQDPDIHKQYQSIFNGMPPTVVNDFKLQIKRSLFTQYASMLGCNIVFTAETISTLAINLLSNISIGRGSQVQNDIGFCDNRDENVKILKPMKEISSVELNWYIKTKKLTPISRYNPTPSTHNSLQSVISLFVNDLQENDHATGSTVSKIADKIGVNDEQGRLKKCVMCKNNITTKSMKISALEATKFSRIVSFTNPRDRNIAESDGQSNMFPYVNQHLCYSCSRNYSQIDVCNLPTHINIY